MTKKPNIFNFATSELSQDAFLCWFLSWAAPECESEDYSLHRCALRFIERIFENHDVKMPSSVMSVELQKQIYNVDVLCVINNEFVILIEDKTDTVQHSNQLERYLTEVKRNYNELTVLPVYYKTGDQGDYKPVEEAGYLPFLRGDMEGVLCEYRGSNDILIDYREHLSAISEEANAYKKKLFEDWQTPQWTGFYLELQKQLKGKDIEAGWGYVANASGGFMGFWWGDAGDEKCQQYLQLENEKLCFKIDVGESECRASLRSDWYEKFIEFSLSEGLKGVVKPPKFGWGGTMTVCQLGYDYRLSNGDGFIDMPKTVELLMKATTVIDYATRANA